MIRKRMILAMLCCAILCGLTVSAAAAVQRINVGDTVTITVGGSGETAIELYAFTPEESGTYVLYLSSGEADQVQIGVLNATTGSGYLSRGTRRCVLEAQAGRTYWFEIECANTDGSEDTVRTFELNSAAAVESVELSVSEYSGSSGEEFWVDVLYTPLNAVGTISWGVEPAGVVQLTAQDSGCLVLLEAPGTAVITATSDNGMAAQCVAEVRDMESLSSGQTVVLEVPAGTETDAVRSYRFVPEKDGTYLFSADPADQILLHVQGSDAYWNGEGQVSFDAKAGESYLLSVNYWGDFAQPMDYTLSLVEYPPMDSFVLETDVSVGHVGDTMYIDVVTQPHPCLMEPITWKVSDPAVASVEYSNESYAELKLLSAGTVTVTAVSRSGKTASMELTVYDQAAPDALSVGESQPIKLPGSGTVELVFTPEESGYYYIKTETLEVFAWTEARVASDGVDNLFVLEAGESYAVLLYNLTETEQTCTIRVEKREFLTPTALEIAKIPDNTTFLRSTVHFLRGHRLLSGLEMKVTWSDGSQSVWCYDTDPMYLGTDFIDYRTVDHGDGTGELVLTCKGITASCPLTILDLMVQRVELVDGSPLRVVENSCGALGEDGWVYAANVYLNRQVRVTFSDGSTVTAYPGEAVYGLEVQTYDNQDEHPWVRGLTNLVEYVYGDLSDYVDVQIVTGNVERVELVTRPKTRISLGDERYFYDYGYDRYFSPTDLKDFLGELSLTIYYTDGTSKKVEPEDIQWLTVMGQEYPYVDGYPLGYFGEAVNSQEPVTEPCRMTNHIEYMGAAAEYTIRFEDEQTPGTGDASLLPAVLLVLCLCAVPVVVRKKLI